MQLLADMMLLSIFGGRQIDSMTAWSVNMLKAHKLANGDVKTFVLAWQLILF